MAPFYDETQITPYAQKYADILKKEMGKKQAFIVTSYEYQYEVFKIRELLYPEKHLIGVYKHDFDDRISSRLEDIPSKYDKIEKIVYFSPEIYFSHRANLELSHAQDVIHTYKPLLILTEEYTSDKCIQEITETWRMHNHGLSDEECVKVLKI